MTGRTPVTKPTTSRREALQTGSAVAAAVFAQMSMPDFVFPGQEQAEALVPFSNMPRTGPNRLDWETLDSWLTPQDQVFSVQHYGIPEFDTKVHQVEITGLVNTPRSFTLDQLRELPKKEQLMTLECSGNGVSNGFMNAIYNSKWTGTPLAPILQSCGIKPEAKEIVFFGVDRKEETLREGTSRELKVEVPFGRSISVDEALNLNLLLAYERNGQPIENRNGAPIRLIVPGWYGIANVKWLQRIELRDSRYMGRYMGRDYVTVRGERHGNEVVFVESSVTRMRLKSIIARVTRQPTNNGNIPTKAYGAVWTDGTAVKRVEVKVNDGAWREAILDKEPRSKYCWTFFSIDLGGLTPGKHTVVSRAIDTNNRIQPAVDDDEIALKKTYWEANQQWVREIELQA